MINNPIDFSIVFSTENEQNSFLLKKKKSILKDFSFTKEREVDKVYSLAFWLHVYGRDEDAVNVCDFLLQKDFDGDNSIWYHIEHAIGLKFVIEKQRHNFSSKHFSYIYRIVYANDKNAYLRAHNEEEVRAYKSSCEGFLNGQCIENELFNKNIVVTYNIPDSCYAVIRELCWLIAANEAYHRETFFIGGQFDNCKLFWDKYYLYLGEIRKYKKVMLDTNKHPAFS
mgnify:CR=1 FL=1